MTRGARPDGQSEERTRREAERDFLLRSLEDLEAEQAAGNVDDATYRRLHDDYTARAAAAIRALEQGDPAGGEPTVSAPGATRRRVLAIGGIAVFLVVAGLGLAAALGVRLPGETATGNSGGTARPERASGRREQLEAAVAANPADIGSRLLLAAELEADSDYVGALKRYDEVLAISPANAQALAHSGRILYLSARGAPAAQAAELVDTARSRLDRSIQADPEFADARFFRAIVLAYEYGDFAGARNDAQRYLLAAPNGRYRTDALALLAQVESAINGTPITPTTTARSSTTTKGS